MRPIQLWLPTLADNLSSAEIQRDAQRAMKSWRGDYSVWLMPDLQEECRWYEPMGDGRHYCPILAIPAEHLDRLDVFHIGENGRVWGLASFSRFPVGRVDGLLDAWLNLFNLVEKVAYYPAPESTTLRVPRIKGRKIEYENSRLKLIPGPTFPFTEFDNKSKIAWVTWPPKARMPEPISPEAESAEYYGPMKRGYDERLPIGISERDPKIRSLHTICVLPKPFDGLVPYGAGMDTLYGYAQMINIAQMSQDDAEGALQKARDAAAPHLTEGWTTRELASFLPMLTEVGEKVTLIHEWFRLNRSEFRTPEEYYQSSEWQKEMEKAIPVRRAWGVLGLFWTMLLDRLKDGKTIQTCEKCGRVNTGKKGKRFCGPEDNQACFRQRRAADRRRERIRHSQD